MTFMCLAILVLLFGGMFLFVKQKLSILESRLNLLTETISTMAGITMNSHSEVEADEADEAESDEEDESESDESESVASIESAESESKIDIEFEIPNLVNVTRVDDDVIVNPIKVIVSDDDVTSPVKQIVVDTSYESLTVKELKEKISELNGPKLKTKKEMVDYLKNKI